MGVIASLEDQLPRLRPNHDDGPATEEFIPHHGMLDRTTPTHNRGT